MHFPNPAIMVGAAEEEEVQVENGNLLMIPAMTLEVIPALAAVHPVAVLVVEVEINFSLLLNNVSKEYFTFDEQSAFYKSFIGKAVIQQPLDPAMLLVSVLLQYIHLLQAF